MDYKQEIELNNDEIAAKINVATGEVIPLASKQKRISTNPNAIPFEPKTMFSRTYTLAWKLLKTQTSDTEFRVAFELALRAKAFTNSLEPLDEDVTVRELAEEFSIGVNSVTKLFKKLYDLGVYGKFEVANQDSYYKRYWVFNPYLSFNGKTIDKGISELFKLTNYALINSRDNSI